MDLRPYQEAALCAWQLDNRRGVVVLPTGAGKTRLAMAAIAQTRLCSLCLVPTLALLEQWVRVIGESYQGQVGCFGDGEHVLRPVTVATFESAYRHMDRIGNRFDLLIVDEAHHFGSGVRDEALEMTIAAARLGLTATPVRRGLAPERLEDLIGGVVFELAISDLVGSFLAPFETMTLRLDLTRGAPRLRTVGASLSGAVQELPPPTSRLVMGDVCSAGGALGRGATGDRCLATIQANARLPSVQAQSASHSPFTTPSTASHRLRR